MQCKKHNSAFWWFILFFSLLVLVFCIYTLLKSMHNTQLIKKEYSNLSQQIHKQEFEDKKEFKNLHTENKNSKNEARKTNEHLQTILSINSDFAGWLLIPNTTIDYPVMYNKDNFYLHHDFYKSSSRHGTPFLDAKSMKAPIKSNILIYGHHMRDGTMFSELAKYKHQRYFKQHTKITFSTLDETATYEISAVCIVDVETDSDMFDYLSSSSNTSIHFSKYKRLIEQKQLYICNNQISENDCLLTLVTCDYSGKDKRLIVVAKKI